MYPIKILSIAMGQATCFLSGSHKAHFPYGGSDRYEPNVGGSPWEANIHDAMESYTCPAGSVVIFTESLVHASQDWTGPKPRIAVFNLYNSVWANWVKLDMPMDTAMSFPPKRRSLFRGVWQIGGPPDNPGNRRYSKTNRASNV